MSGLESTDSGNSIVNTADTGEETGAITDTNSVDDREQAHDQGAFLDGFEDGETLDAEQPTESNSLDNKEVTEEKNEAEENEEPAQTRSKRPDKRQRELNAVMAERDQLQREVAYMRQQQAMAANQVELPQADDDGNYTIDQILQYTESRTDQRVREQLAEYENRLLEIEQSKNAELAANNIDSMFSEVKNQYPVLDSKSSEYNAKIEAAVANSVERAVMPFLANGSGDYAGMVEAARQAMDDVLAVYGEGSASSGRNNRASREAIRASSALISKDTGEVSADDDDFLKGFAVG